jgi:light-regulated signal transduction histidine kinase (bacteriophytochrome)
MISIYTQFLHRKLQGTLDPVTESYMENVLRGAERLEALIRDLLAYTQSTDPTGPDTTAADANEALDRALSNLSAAVEESGALIRSSKLPVVLIAPVRLTQLLQNLIGNALKYRSEAVPEINIDAARYQEEWKFSVSDNGIGIEERFKEHIFGIFKRLHQTDEYPGTGIGLAICQRIVERAGGRIWVESTPGHGSTFYFTLPAANTTS